MFANTVIIPLTISNAFQLSPGEMAGALQRSFIFTGIACILQALIGHKFPIMEGQSGFWWGAILSLTASASGSGMSLRQLGGAIETGIILSGILVSLLGVFGIGRLLNRLFSPIVMSTVFFLLASQLILIFSKGMLGLTKNGVMNPPVAALSLFLILLVSFLNIIGRGLLSNLSILIGIVTGWVIYVIMFPAIPANFHSPLFINLFPWGEPNFQVGIIIMVIITGLVNTTNTMAAIKGVEPILKKSAGYEQFRHSFLLTGIYSIISGLFGLVPYAPYISSVGFLQSTNIVELLPFLIGAVLFMIMGLVPILGHFFSTMPMSVGDAVLFVAYLQLFGGALSNLEGLRFSPKTIYRIAAPLFIGIAIMNLPANVFEPIPMILRPLISNGLIMGILAAILLDNLIDWNKVGMRESKSNKHWQSGKK